MESVARSRIHVEDTADLEGALCPGELLGSGLPSIGSHADIRIHMHINMCISVNISMQHMYMNIYIYAKCSGT